MMVCSHGALSGVWMLLLLRRCSRDAQILPAGAATRRPSLRTDGLRDETLPASSVLSSSRGKREKENSKNGVFLWRIFAFWRNNHNTRELFFADSLFFKEFFVKNSRIHQNKNKK
jgi:hypothetical protein